MNDMRASASALLLLLGRQHAVCIRVPAPVPPATARSIRHRFGTVRAAG